MKPSCKCQEQIIEGIRKQNKYDKETEIYFTDVDLFTGSLTNVVIAGVRKIINGKEVIRDKRTTIAHSFCAFCGKKYSGN